MKKLTTLLCALALSMAALSGCANNPLGAGNTGTILGGAAGGAVGSQIGSGTGKTIATVIGTLGGAVLGREIGQSMGRRDRQHFGSALENNQTGNTSTWQDPNNNNSYSVTPTRTYNQGRQPCREFTMNANVNGRPDQVHGTACRQPDGSWKVQS